MSKMRLITTEELAKQLQVRPDTIRKWARRGLIPQIRVTSKVIRFDLESVIDLIHERQRREGAS